MLSVTTLRVPIGERDLEFRQGSTQSICLNSQAGVGLSLIGRQKLLHSSQSLGVNYSSCRLGTHPGKSEKNYINHHINVRICVFNICLVLYHFGFANLKKFQLKYHPKLPNNLVFSSKFCFGIKGTSHCPLTT